MKPAVVLGAAQPAGKARLSEKPADKEGKPSKYGHGDKDADAGLDLGLSQKRPNPVGNPEDDEEEHAYHEDARAQAMHGIGCLQDPPNKKQPNDDADLRQQQQGAGEERIQQVFRLP